MNDRAWMYTGHPSQKNMTEEWMTKTEEFLEVAFSAGQPRTWCPCTSCKNYSQQTKDVMGTHLQMRGIITDYTLWSFHGESVQRDRHEVVRSPLRIVVQGSKTWSITTTMLVMRTKNRRKL